MAERMTVIVVPQNSQENLTVEDAMRQVLSVFELLSSTTREGGNEVAWRLIEAKTNSPPFTVTAEAFTSAPNIDVEEDAKFQKQELLRSFAEFKEGRIPDQWQEDAANEAVMSLFNRLRNNRLEIYVDSTQAPITLTDNDRQNAEALTALNVAHDVSANSTKTQIGSINGVFSQITTYHNTPAVIIRENKTGRDIACIVSEELKLRITKDISIGDVWEHVPVIVRGEILYGIGRGIKRVIASDIQRKEKKEMSLDQIRDRNFTNGLTVAEYLDKLREGTLG